MEKEERAIISVDEALAFSEADRLISEYGLQLHLYGPESGLWYAAFEEPGSDTHLGSEYVRAPTRSQAIQRAAAQARQALGVEEVVN